LQQAKYAIAFAKRRSSLIRNRIRLSCVLDIFEKNNGAQVQESVEQVHDSELQKPNNRLLNHYEIWKAFEALVGGKQA
jgi:hypothetical protein